MSSYRNPRTNRPQRANRNINTQPLGSETPLEGFFSRYPKFTYNLSNSPKVEFDRLYKLYEWEKGGRARKAARIAARDAFNIALKEEFDTIYGLDEHDIKNWRKLCHVLRINPVPDTLRECRSVSCRSFDPLRPWYMKAPTFTQTVLKKHVNLMDLVHGSKEEVTIFKTEKLLSEYTKETGKYFPKEEAKDGGVLRALRRHILAPREDTHSSRRNKTIKS